MNELNSNPLVFAGPTATGSAARPAARPALTDRLCRALVFRTLTPMFRGRLTMRLPDGSQQAFGTGENGPTAEMVIRSPRFFRHCVLHADIGFGETYQDGDWDSPDLFAVIAWFCANVDSSPSMSGSTRKDWRVNLLALVNRVRHSLNRNSLAGSKANIHAHYDLGNAFYSLWLDPTMTYSAALFEFPDQDLAAAQSAKYERLCRELRLKPSDHVLEIGSGWGGFAEHAVRNYGCRVTTVTISEEQRKFCGERFARAGIADRAEVRLQDYRRLTGQFDKICSIEMLEAVGDQFLESYFAKVQSLLAPHGLFAAQFITCPDARYAELRRGVDWIQKHVFPGSLLLSMNRVGQAVQQTGSLSLHHLHDLGLDYARTLRVWRGRFNARLDEVRRLGFDDRFIRTWNYYLAYCEAAFAWRNISVVQATWTAPNNRSLMG
ncbi:MAG TPA: cyclopropane-fatty-acyl-phospholipid synthase family protein [Candidatus Limnocylindria bacterium]|nr:cyclopropane-fatty-acyl-phospholipid synthase family protein [Candidatus Limnocylindria bacterium]